MQNAKIAVIGLRYVGLPLARLFSTKFETIGLDMKAFVKDGGVIYDVKGILSRDS